MSAEIELVGGPADGRRTVVQGDPLDPPLTHRVYQAISGTVWATARQGDRKPGAGMTLHLYRREASRSDDGSLWQYRYDSGADPRPGKGPTP